MSEGWASCDGGGLRPAAARAAAAPRRWFAWGGGVECGGGSGAMCIYICVMLLDSWAAAEGSVAPRLTVELGWARAPVCVIVCVDRIVSCVCYSAGALRCRVCPVGVCVRPDR